MPERAFSAVPKRIKNPAATSKSPRTQMKLAPGGARIKLTVSLVFYSSAKHAHFFLSRSPSTSRPKGARCSLSSASSTLRLVDMEDDGALVVLSDCYECAGEAFL